MIIYRDLTSEDKNELISDAYPIIQCDNGLWEVDCRKVTVGGEDIVLEGANASAEGEDAEDVENQSQQVLDIQRDFRLQEGMQYDKKQFMGIMKTYMKNLEKSMKAAGKSDDEIKQMKTDAQAAIPKLAGKIKDFDIFIGESADPETPGWPVMVNYRDDGVTPYATYFKWGLEEYKV